MTFQEIGCTRGVSVEIDTRTLVVGGQGSVFFASVDGEDGYCVKAVTGIVDAAALDSQVRLFADLRDMLDGRTKQPDSSTSIRRSLKTLRDYLPVYAAFAAPPESHTPCLLLLRKRCPGVSLQEMMQCDLAFNVRLDMAKRLVYLLNTLFLNGFIHLDCYPDNVFVVVNGNSVKELCLIDLEGMGHIERDNNGRFSPRADRWIREPTALGKPGEWVWPPWYPRLSGGDKSTPFRDLFPSASRWQALAVVLATLTGGGLPFAWLAPSSFNQVASAWEDCQRARSLECHLTDVDGEVLEAFADRMDGNWNLLSTVKEWLSSGFMEPHAVPSISTIQAKLNTI
jgi:hypothetical protein